MRMWLMSLKQRNISIVHLTILRILIIKFLFKLFFYFHSHFSFQKYFSKSDYHRSLLIGYQCGRAPFWQWTILSKMAQCFNNLPPTCERSLPLPSRAPWGPLWILPLSTLLNPLALSLHPFICIAWSLVLPLCLVSLRNAVFRPVGLFGPCTSPTSHLPITLGCCSVSFLAPCFESWISLYPRLGSNPQIPRLKKAASFLIGSGWFQEGRKDSLERWTHLPHPLLLFSFLALLWAATSSGRCWEIPKISELSSFNFTADEEFDSARTGGPCPSRLNIQRIIFCLLN